MFSVHQVLPKPPYKAQWKGEEDRADRGRGGKTTSGMDRPGVRQVAEGSGEQGKMEKTGCKIICGAPTTLAVKGLKMIIKTVIIVFWDHYIFNISLMNTHWIEYKRCQMALSTIFHSINSQDNSPLSHSVLPILFLPYWSFQLHISLWKSPSALI